MSEDESQTERAFFYECEDLSKPPFSIAKDEVNRHYHFFGGGADRYWVQPAALFRDDEKPRRELLVPVDGPEEKDIANEFARYFVEETGYDYPPYSSKETRPDSEQVFLINSRDIAHGSFDFMVGATAIELHEGKAILMWIWLHPFARGSSGKSLALRVWESLEARFGELGVLAPASKPMSRFIEKNRPGTKFYSMDY